MDNSKSDRRVSRTKRLLREALMSLVLEKGFEAVTVEDITERADLGRTTFYLHYKDKEELLLESIETTIDDLKERIQLSQLVEMGESEGTRIPIHMVFEHAAANASLYRIILRDEGASRTAKGLRVIISQAVVEFLTDISDNQQMEFHPTIPIDIFAQYFAGALMSFVGWWLEDQSVYSEDEMTDMFRKLFFMGGFKVLGLPIIE
jgi:AcrR family transcriptional regulator